MDESTFQEGMARLIRITNKNRQTDGADAVSPEAVGGYHICKMCNHVWKIRKSNPNPKSCPSCHSTIWNSALARKLRCYRCGHEWVTNIEHPTMCPHCKSRTYDSETLTISCRKCGSRWEDDMNTAEVTCPKCGTISRDDIKIVPRVENPEPDDDRKPTGDPPLIDSTDVERLSKQPDDYSRLVYLNKIGFGPTEADILVRYMNEQKPVDIALELGIPLGVVFETIVPYIDAAGTEAH